MILSGPITYLYNDKKFLCLWTKRTPLSELSIELNIVTPQSQLDRIEHCVVELSGLSKNSLHKHQVHEHIELLRIDVSKLIRSQRKLQNSLKDERGKLIYYNILLKGHPVVKELELVRLRGRQKSRHDLRTISGRLIGPVTIFKKNRTVDQWICASCTDIAFEKTSALALMEKRIRSELSRFPKKNIALNLMGDQIYADSVSYELMVIYNLILKHVFEGKGTLRNWNRVTNRRTHTRTLWSQEAYHAAYLLNFGRLYEYLFDSQGSFKDESKKATSHLPKQASGSIKDGTRISALRTKQLRRIAGVATLLPSIFARVPVMMMWDDHDVVDDWNIDSTWAQRPANKKRTEAAITPLAIYQAPFLTSDQIGSFKVNRSSSSIQFEPRINRSFATNREPVRHLTLSMRNNELIASGIQHRWIESGLARQDQLIEKYLSQQAATKVSQTIFTNTQVLSPRIVLQSQNLFSFQWWNREVDKEAIDVYPSALLTVLDALPAKTQLISGDVHYGYHRDFEYHADGEKKIFKQISASAISNEPQRVLKTLVAVNRAKHANAYSTLYLGQATANTGLLIIHVEQPEFVRFEGDVTAMLNWIRARAIESINTIESSLSFDDLKADLIKTDKVRKLRALLIELSKPFSYERVLHTHKLKTPYITSPNFVIVEHSKVQHVTSTATIT